MIKIMFVCLGNICRSPMAEFYFRDLLQKAGLAHLCEVASAATSDDEIPDGKGHPVYPPAREQLARRGIGCEGKRAVRLKAEDYDRYDLFLGMDSGNISDMCRLFGGDPKGKVRKLLSFAGSDRDVADPWFTRDFDKAFGDIETGCLALLKTLRESGFGERQN